MKILIVGDYTDRPERAIYKGLQEAGHEVEIVINPADKLCKPEDDTGIIISPLNIRSRLDFEAIRFLRNNVNEKKHDVIYATSKRTLTHCLLATTKTSIPIVAYRGVMGNVNFRNPEAYFGLTNKRVKKIICVCHAVRGYLLAQGFSDKKVITVHKGHDPKWYNLKTNGKDKLKELGIPSNSFVMNCVAQMRPRKGIHILLEALNYMPKNSAHMLLIGKIRDSRIAKDIEKYNLQDNVHCLGFRTDAVELAGASDLCVMPSLKREGLPKGVIESMIQGIPAVVTSVGGLPELVEHNKSGLVVPPSDAKALAEAITFFQTSPDNCRKFGEQARKRMETDFSYLTTIKRTLDVFSAAIEDSQQD